MKARRPVCKVDGGVRRQVVFLARTPPRASKSANSLGTKGRHAPWNAARRLGRPCPRLPPTPPDRDGSLLRGARPPRDLPRARSRDLRVQGSGGVCPSCAGRRMSNTAAHLVDRVLPAVPVRQWVLSLPFELRALAAFRADVLSAIGRLFVEALFARYRARARDQGLGALECGAVTFVQRFGSSLTARARSATPDPWWSRRVSGEEAGARRRQDARNGPSRTARPSVGAHSAAEVPARALPRGCRAAQRVAKGCGAQAAADPAVRSEASRGSSLASVANAQSTRRASYWPRIS